MFTSSLHDKHPSYNEYYSHVLVDNASMKRDLLIRK